MVIIILTPVLTMVIILKRIKKMLEKIKGFLGNSSETVIEVLIGIAILVIGLFLVKIITALIKKGFGKVSLLNGDSGPNLVKPIATLFKGVMTIFVLLMALPHFGMDSIVTLLEDMIGQITNIIPNILGAGVIIYIGYFVAKIIIDILESFFATAKVDELPEKMGLTSVFSDNFTPTKLFSALIMFFIMLTSITAAVDTLGIESISTIFAKTLEFAGGILIGGLILVIGNFFSQLAYDNLKKHGSDTLANIARFAILGLVLAMGLKAMGIADHIVNLAFALTLGSVAVAGAIAFGLGGRDAAKTLTEKWTK